MRAVHGFVNRPESKEETMRKTTIINDNWLFRYHDGTETKLDLPHTWNDLDGQDGGGDEAGSAPTTGM